MDWGVTTVVSEITDSSLLAFLFFNGDIDNSRNLPNPSAFIFLVYIQDNKYIRARGKKPLPWYSFQNRPSSVPRGVLEVLGVQLTLLTGLVLLLVSPQSLMLRGKLGHCPSAISASTCVPDLYLDRFPRLSGATYKKWQRQLHTPPRVAVRLNYKKEISALT